MNSLLPSVISSFIFQAEWRALKVPPADSAFLRASAKVAINYRPDKVAARESSPH
jgi:hypothetical protein